MVYQSRNRSFKEGFAVNIEHAFVDDMLPFESQETIITISHEKKLAYIYSNNASIKNTLKLEAMRFSNEIEIMFETYNGIQIAVSNSL